MKNKGFTLIELLAVIVVLAVIMVIAVGSVNKQIKKARKDSFEQTANSISRSSKQLYMSMAEGQVIDFEDYKNELELDGKLPTKGKVIIHDNGDVSFAVTDGEYCAIKNPESSAIKIDKSGKYCLNPSSNLIKNGYGELGNNTNFIKFTFNKDVNPFFTRTSSAGLVVSTDEFIEVDPSKTYYQSIEMKSDKSTTIYYAGLLEFDVDKNIVDCSNYISASGKPAYLTKDLNNGDTVINFNDISGFKVDQNTPKYKLSLIFWNYKDSTGYEYPELTYSRNSWSDLYLYSGVNKTNNTITLKTPWNKGYFKVGTPVSQTYPDGFNYGLVAGKKLTNNWQTFSSSITGINSPNINSYVKFRPGTKYIKLSLIDNASAAPNVTTYYRNMIFMEVD